MRRSFFNRYIASLRQRGVEMSMPEEIGRTARLLSEAGAVPFA
jgi:hypothetical protein